LAVLFVILANQNNLQRYFWPQTLSVSLRAELLFRPLSTLV